MAPKDHYYKILGVDKKADDAAIKSAYKKAALKHHPDRNPNKQDEARKKFQEISEAFEVLSDPNKRAVYDQFGEEGLKGRPPPPGAGGASGGPSGFSSAGHGMGGFPGGGGTFFTSTGGAPGGAGFTPTDPEQIFRAFFSSSGDAGGGLGGLFSGMGGGGMGGMGGGGPGAGRRPPSGFGFGGMDVDDESEEDIRGMRGGMPGGFGMNGGARAGPSASAAPAPPETVKPHPFALEDLYKGGTKKLKVMRKKANGRDEPVIVEVPLKPGWKAGTKIRFPHQGNEDAAGRAATLCIEVQQKPHPKFTRDGDDLVYVYKLSLSEALTGTDPSTSSPPSTTRTIDTLDGRKLSFPIAFPTAARGGPPIQPGQVLKKFVGEGMPISRKGAPKPKGDLIVKADVALPDRVTGQQVEAFKRLLGGGSS